MRSIDSWLDRFCYKHPKFGIPNLMIYLIAANITIFVLDLEPFCNGMISYMLSLDPSAILGGQVWRLFTFVLVPNYSKPIWFIVSMLFYYFLGTTMEREWGTAKFTLFYLCGALLTIISAFIFRFTFQLIFHSPWTYGTSLYYIHQSLFLAFATLYPETPMRFYFVIPIKAKWMAALWLFMQFYDITQIWGPLIPLFLPQLLLALLSAIINYLIFFWSDVSAFFRRFIRRTRHQNSKQTINFKAATKQAQERKGYLHKCAVCGKTDTDCPDEEFRYCSQCDGYYCYCSEHIHNHVHIK